MITPNQPDAEAGAGRNEAMALGNLAAGIVVTKPGTATTDLLELIETLDLLGLPE